MPYYEDPATAFIFGVVAALTWSIAVGVPLLGLLLLHLGTPSHLMAAAALGVWAGTRHRPGVRAIRVVQTLLTAVFVGLVFHPAPGGPWLIVLGGLFIAASGAHAATCVAEPIPAEIPSTEP